MLLLLLMTMTMTMTMMMMTDEDDSHPTLTHSNANCMKTSRNFVQTYEQLKFLLTPPNMNSFFSFSTEAIPEGVTNLQNNLP